MFENMLGHKNNVKLTKELKAYFKKANLPASISKGMWIVNSFEMFLINEAIDKNIIDDKAVNINFEKLINIFKKEICNINTVKKLDLLSKIYDFFYMEIYGEILEVSRFCLMTSMYIESGIITEKEIFTSKRLFQEGEIQKLNSKKLN